MEELTDEYSYGVKPDSGTERTHTKRLNGVDAAVTKETYDYAGRLVRVDNPDGGHSANEYSATETFCAARTLGGKPRTTPTTG